MAVAAVVAVIVAAAVVVAIAAVVAVQAAVMAAASHPAAATNFYAGGAGDIVACPANLNRLRRSSRQFPNLRHLGRQQDSEDRVPELHPHLPADKPPANHRRSPSRAMETHQNRFRAVLRVSRYQYLSVSPVFHGVSMMTRRDFHNRAGGQAGQFHAAIDFRLADGIIDRIVEVRNRREDAAVG